MNFIYSETTPNGEDRMDIHNDEEEEQEEDDNIFQGWYKNQDREFSLFDDDINDFETIPSNRILDEDDVDKIELNLQRRIDELEQLRFRLMPLKWGEHEDDVPTNLSTYSLDSDDERDCGDQSQSIISDQKEERIKIECGNLDAILEEAEQQMRIFKMDIVNILSDNIEYQKTINSLRKESIDAQKKLYDQQQREIKRNSDGSSMQSHLYAKSKFRKKEKINK